MGQNDNQNQDNNTETGTHRDMIPVINWRERSVTGILLDQLPGESSGELWVRARDNADDPRRVLPPGSDIEVRVLPGVSSLELGCDQNVEGSDPGFDYLLTPVAKRYPAPDENDPSPQPMIPRHLEMGRLSSLL